MTWSAALRAAILVLACVLVAARAQAGTVILLLLDPDAGVLGMRVRGELEAVGFTVISKPLTEASLDPVNVLAEARASGAAAAIRVKPKQGATDIWVIDRVTGKTVLREVPTPEPRDDVLLAVKTTELLRASLLEVDAPGFKPAEVSAPPEIHRLVAPPARGAVELGGGASFGGSLGTTGFVRAGLAARAARWIWIGARFDLPVVRPSREGPEGSASITLSRAEARVEAAPWRDRRITPLISLSAGASWLRAAGDATPPYVSRTADVVSAAIGARAGASVRLAGRLRLRIDGGASVLLPRPRVLFADRVAGAATTPLPDVAGALEVDAF